MPSGSTKRRKKQNKMDALDLSASGATLIRSDSQNSDLEDSAASYIRSDSSDSLSGRFQTPDSGPRLSLTESPSPNGPRVLLNENNRQRQDPIIPRQNPPRAAVPAAIVPQGGLPAPNRRITPAVRALNNRLSRILNAYVNENQGRDNSNFRAIAGIESSLGPNTNLNPTEMVEVVARVRSLIPGAKTNNSYRFMRKKRLDDSSRNLENRLSTFENDALRAEAQIVQALRSEGNTAAARTAAERASAEEAHLLELQTALEAVLPEVEGRNPEEAALEMAGEGAENLRLALNARRNASARLAIARREVIATAIPLARATALEAARERVNRATAALEMAGEGVQDPIEARRNAERELAEAREAAIAAAHAAELPVAHAAAGLDAAGLAVARAAEIAAVRAATGVVEDDGGADDGRGEGQEHPYALPVGEDDEDDDGEPIPVARPIVNEDDERAEREYALPLVGRGQAKELGDTAILENMQAETDD